MIKIKKKDDNNYLRLAFCSENRKIIQSIVFAGIYFFSSAIYACEESHFSYFDAAFSQPVAQLHLANESAISDCFNRYFEKYKPSTPFNAQIDLMNAFSPEHALKTLTTYSDHIRIHELNLSFTNQLKWVKILPQLLMQQPLVHTIDLSYTDFKNSTMKEKSRLLQASQTVNRLLLSGNGIDGSFLSDSNVVTHYRSELDLSDNPLGNSGVTALLDQLKDRADKQVILVKLNFVKAGNEGLQKLIDFANQHPNVSIEFRGNFFSDELLQNLPFNIVT